MKHRTYKTCANTLTARLTAVGMALLLISLSGIQHICLAGSICESDCCETPVVQPGCCCSEEAPAQDVPARDSSTPTQGEAPCCINVDGSLLLGLTTAPPQVPTPLLGAISFIPALQKLPGTPAGPAVTASPPPLRIPLHIVFCCPLT